MAISRLGLEPPLLGRIYVNPTTLLGWAYDGQRASYDLQNSTHIGVIASDSVRSAAKVWHRTAGIEALNSEIIEPRVDIEPQKASNIDSQEASNIEGHREASGIEQWMSRFRSTHGQRRVKIEGKHTFRLVISGRRVAGQVNREIPGAPRPSTTSDAPNYGGIAHQVWSPGARTSCVRSISWPNKCCRAIAGLDYGVTC